MVELAYNQEYFDKLAFRICSETGARNTALCKIFGLSKQDLSHWMSVYPSFRDAVITGRDKFYAEKIEKSLIRRALGYTYTEIETGIRDSKTVEIKRKKHVPADVEAIKTYLRYREPTRWKDQEKDADPVLEKIFAMIMDKTRQLPSTREPIAIEAEVMGGDAEGTQATRESHDTLYRNTH